MSTIRHSAPGGGVLHEVIEHGDTLTVAEQEPQWRWLQHRL
jgi:hypothetical protein